ncbi:MAG: NADH-quinone oxidoreductase subunit L, partial [Rhodococcus sp. (in: high G+C Gram-positive bacteria)]
VPAWLVTALALTVVAIGVGIAYAGYARRPVPSTAPEPVSALTSAARRDLYGDAVNEALLMRPGLRVTRAVERFDDSAVSGSTRAVAAGVSTMSTRIRRVQTGYVRSYALTMLAGTAVVAAMMVAVMVW